MWVGDVTKGLPYGALAIAAATVAVAAVAWAAEPAASEQPTKRPLRAGIIGCDTSHVIAFATSINAPDATGHLAEVQVVAAYPGGSEDIPESKDRLAGFVDKLREMNVEIVDSIDELLTKVDVVLLESVDGRPHLAQARPVIAAGKPLFIDKPMAGNLAEAVEIARLAAEHKPHPVPWFSSSVLRYGTPAAVLIDESKVGKITGCNVYAPCSVESHHPELFWYGIHGVECMYTLMGPGCRQVTRVPTGDGDIVVVGTWDDGRIGVFRGQRAGHNYGATAFGTKGTAWAERDGNYEPLVAEICKFFVTGKPPVPPETTLEIYAFMQAAEASKQQDGATVELEAVMDAARAAAPGS